MSEADARARLAQVPGWELAEGGGRLARRFSFPDFASAMAFAVEVGELAEKEGHHPDITFGWGYCNLLFYTHKIGGLHENDFIMAAKANALYREPS